MKHSFFLLFTGLLINLTWAQSYPFKDKTVINYPGSQYRFEIIKQVKVTPVKDQNYTGTCWAFSSVSFIESELLRMGKGTYNLSEMWIARNAYIGKAENFLRMDGHLNFGQGGEFHDFFWVMERYGLVPEKAYPGLNYGEKNHNHSELYAVLKGELDALKKLPQKHHLTTAWKKAFTESVDAYLGQVPDNVKDFKFTYKGKTYNPYSFAQSLGINPDDYVELTSFTHHPFYTYFTLELPDNWSLQQAFNVPIDELVEAVEHALKKGYSVAWGGDVSEKGFSHRKGLAVLPENLETVKDKKSTELSFEINGKKIPNAFMQPVPQAKVTQEERQKYFDNKLTTDDHGMHIVGIAQDQNGTKYFIVKNSWAADSNKLGGYFFVSYAYFKLKTTGLMINKNALPEKLRKKL